MLQIILPSILSLVILPNYSVLSENSATNFGLNDSECGTRALCDGTESTVKKWPWVASIYFKDPVAKGETKLHGTATIITNKHLITAANVVSSRYSNSSVNSSTDFFAVLGGKVNGVNSIIYDIQSIHRYFKTEDPVLGGGLAIIRLVNEIEITDCIRPICLPTIGRNPGIQHDRSLIAIDWNDSSDNSSGTPVLYEINVQLQPEDYCQQFIKNPYPTDRLVCAESSKETAYKFGNGGPLMASTNGIFTIVGVTDTNIGDQIHLPSGIPDVPIYFLTTESLTHMSWIKDIIQHS